MNTAIALSARCLRRCPLAGCLAAALALAAGTTTATPSKVPSGAVEMLERLHSGLLPDLPRRWKRPEPDDLARRNWHPAPHELPTVPANAIVVQNCNDSGAGSLRQALADANSGDTIDLTQLSCSSITLTTGSILFTQTSVTLQGPGSKYLSISGGDLYAPLLHAGNGTLYVNDLTVQDGMKYFTDAQIDDARGGCIFSAGTVFVSGSSIDHCRVTDTSTSNRARGGAIYGTYGVSLSNSSVTNSYAVSTYGGYGGGVSSAHYIDVVDSFVAGNFASSHGGGIYSIDLHVKYSTILDNATYGIGGGAEIHGNVTISNATIAQNSACLGGGLALIGSAATEPETLLSSTVSGNSACEVGGVYIGSQVGSRVSNDTIAFNYESNPTKYGAGMFIYGTSDVESTIVSNNTYAGGTAPDDVGGSTSAVFDGGNNLVGFSLVPVPGDTIHSSARLAPLAYNGGSTATHMLLSASPAINAGNDISNVSYDQRGDGFPRTIGAGTDIGAFELNTADVIFADGFDP